jgi:hypothetical protein
MKDGRILVVIGLAALLDVACLSIAGEKKDPKILTDQFKTTTRKKDDTIEVRGEKDKALFIVKSPSGISQVVIERQSESWPKAVAVQLHLKGLERFVASNGKTTLHAAVSLQDGKPKVRQWKDGKENAGLDDKSPLWMDIRILGGDGKPAKALPLQNGHFEISLPKAFFEANPQSITLSWIDFIR